MAKIEFTEQTISDINEIASYIALDSFHYAGLQVSKIFGRTGIIEDQLYIGRVVPN
jgi:hypothetical protein